MASLSNATLFDTNPSKSVNNWQQNIAIGIVLSVIANVVISISLNVQKLTHMRLAVDGHPQHYSKTPLWWLGILLLATGEVGNFIAYGFAPASLVAPLGTITVVSNTFIAVVFLHEKLRPTDVFGACLAVTGCVLTIYFSNMIEPVLNATQIIQHLISIPFLIYISLEVVLLVVLLVLIYHFKKESPVTFLLCASTVSSFTVICAKGASGMIRLTTEGDNQLKSPVFYFMIVTMLLSAVTSVIFLNKAMQRYNATVVVPTHFALFTISAICAGAIFFSEFQGFGTLQIVMFVLGCVLAFVGVFFIQRGRKDPSEPLDEEETIKTPPLATNTGDGGTEGAGLVKEFPNSVTVEEFVVLDTI